MRDIISSARRSSLYYPVFVFLGAVIALLGASLPYLAENISVELTSSGYLFSIRSLGYLLGSFTISRLYDRFPGNKLMAGTLGVMALMIVFIPISPYAGVLAALIFVTGMGLGGMDVGGNTLVMWEYKERSGPYLSGLFFFAGLGGILSPLLLGWFLKREIYFGWVYWLLVILMIPVLLGLLRRKSPAPPVESRSETSGKTDFWLVVLFGLLFFIYISLEVSYGGWVYSFVLITEPGNVPAASYLTSAFWLAITAGRLITIPFAARAHPGHILLVSLIGALASLGLMLLLPGSFAAVVVGTVGLGLSIASLSPVTLSLAERSMPIHGRITGWLWVFGSIGAIITPWLVGRLIGSINPTAMIAALFVYAAAGVIVFLGLNIFRSRRASSAV
jgi:FHS family Na+ dependent glucose MFS transporter 1